MIKVTFRLSFAFTLWLCSFQLAAQVAVSAAGGDAGGDGGSVSYTIGEVFFHTYNGIVNSVAEGVQQPYEISVVYSDDSQEVDIVASVSPNPATDYLNLTIESDVPFNVESIKYMLCDLNGKPLERKKLSSNMISISMISLKPGSYFVKVVQGNRVIDVFKVIKR